MLPYALSALIGYLFGSFPSGVVVTRWAGAADPRGIGSRNIGATNVLRTGRKGLAALTLFLDALKGAAAVLVVRLAGPALDPAFDPTMPLVAAAGAFFGHLFPIFIGFRGGKGVATFLGCLAALAWPVALAFAVIWLAVASLTRYSSLSALAASIATPLLLAAIGQSKVALLFAVLAAALWIKHSANIGRLLRGAESRIGQRREEPT